MEERRPENRRQTAQKKNGKEEKSDDNRTFIHIYLVSSTSSISSIPPSPSSLVR